MAKQLVISGDRILAHGEDCFLAMGGTVVCPSTGRTYQNATVVNHEGEIPTDIGEVGYKYHAGTFVPCAPFGKGDGNIAVVCGNDCKAIKDSNIPVSRVAQIACGSYTGNGHAPTLTADFAIKMVFVKQRMPSTATKDIYQMSTFCGSPYGVSHNLDNGSGLIAVGSALQMTWTSNSVTWSRSGAKTYELLANSGSVYDYILVG